MCSRVTSRARRCTLHDHTSERKTVDATPSAVAGRIAPPPRRETGRSPVASSHLRSLRSTSP
eukprot:6086516-Prymnesium_polylepis.1